MPEKPETKLRKMRVEEHVVQAQWDLFADEYNIPDDSELKGDDPTTQALKQLKASWLRMLRAGLIEIVADSAEGIVVKQFLSHHVEGVKESADGRPQFIVYHAPTVSTIAQARLGTASGAEVPSAQRYMKYAASATNVSEGVLCQLRGGDTARMGEIAQLFLTV